MTAKTEAACFVIADISGYTSFMAEVELDHAHDIIADLMNTLLKRLRPTFRLAKFEGDAAFVYAVADKIDGSRMQDAVESAYFAFRKRLRNIKQSTTCTCKACSRMQDLDLKFVAHHGEFIKQRMGGREELAGSDVILVHRLLKNAAGERVGGHAYALYSDASIRATGIDPVAQGLTEHHEAIDILGNVTCWVRDLETAWAEDNDRQRNEVTRDKSRVVLEFDFAVPRAVVWDHFVMPELRPKWRHVDEVREAADPGNHGGRRGIGTVNHCMHGAAAIVEEILDWRPYDYLTLTTLVPIPDAPKIPMSYAFIEQPGGGTRVEIRLAKPKPKDEAFFDKVVGNFKERITHEVGVLRTMLEGQPDVVAALQDPAIPAQMGRSGSQPAEAPSN
jgi:uncharacterized protein YndB with AHSA1/START domain